MRKSIVILLFMFTLSSFQLFTNVNNDNKNRVKQILMQLNEYYNNNPNYWVDIEYAQFDESNKLVQKINGFYKHYNEFEHSQQLGIETIVNKQGKILIDTSKKVIILQPYTKNSIREFAYDQYLNSCNDVTLIDSGKIKQIHFFLNPKNGGVKKYVLSIEENRIKQLEIVKMDPSTLKFNTIQISFSKYKNNKRLKESETSFDAILENNKNTFSTRKKYIGFKIIGTFNT